MGASLLAVCSGACLGSVLRWGLGNALNALFPLLPLGTLIANLLGGYLIGVAMVAFTAFPVCAPEWRLLIMTGFLGSLTTFSTFSAEVALLLQQGRYGWAAVAISAHVAGSLLMTFLGMASAAFASKLL